MDRQPDGGQTGLFLYTPPPIKKQTNKNNLTDNLKTI